MSTCPSGSVPSTFTQLPSPSQQVIKASSRINDGFTGPGWTKNIRPADLQNVCSPLIQGLTVVISLPADALLGNGSRIIS